MYENHQTVKGDIKMGQEKQISIELDNVFNGLNAELEAISKANNYPKDALNEYIIEKLQEE